MERIVVLIFHLCFFSSFLTPPPLLSKMTPNLNSSLLAHPFALGQGHLSFPSLLSANFSFLFSFTPSLLLLIAFLFSFRWPQKRSDGSLGQSRPLRGLTWQGQAESAAPTRWYVLIASASAVYQSALGPASLGAAGLTGCKLRFLIWFLFKRIDGESISYFLQRLHVPRDPSFSLTREQQNISLDAVFCSIFFSIESYILIFFHRYLP